MGLDIKSNHVLNNDLRYIHDNLSTFEKNKLSNKNILITGCCGFLGYYLVNYLVKYKNDLNISKVIGLDNLFYKKDKLFDFKKNEFEFIKVDIINDDISKIFEKHTIDFAIHAASIASPTFYRKFPIQTFDVNVIGLRKILDLLKEKEPEGILFFSTSEIYGDPTPKNIPTSEEYNGNVSSLGPRACYDESKRFGETICWVYNQEYKLPIRIVRPFNNYGPGLSIGDKRLPADLALSIINNKDIILYSDGSPTRTYCYIADAIVGYIKAMVHNKFQVFNIGIDKPELSVLDFAKIFIKKGKKIFGYNKKLLFKKSSDLDYLEHNPNRRCPNIIKAKTELTYDPSIDPNEGVERYLTHLKLNGNK